VSLILTSASSLLSQGEGETSQHEDAPDSGRAPRGTKFGSSDSRGEKPERAISRGKSGLIRQHAVEVAERVSVSVRLCM